MRCRLPLRSFSLLVATISLAAAPALAQLNDVTQTPNTANAGIQKSLVQQIGAGRGDTMTPDSSRFVIARDPFRAIARGRSLFQRKFRLAEGLGPRTDDGLGDIEQDGSLGAGLADSCAACHGRPFGSAGVGGNVFTRPVSRDAPHLFGLGLVEMLADEITADLRAIRAQALADAVISDTRETRELVSKGISYGFVTAFPNGSVNTSMVEGVNPDLRVRPFFHEGSTISIREFVVGALNAEMGLESPDPDIGAASAGADVLTPAGMLLSGTIDAIEAPPVGHPAVDGDGDGVANEVDPALVDHLEVYLLNYFKPGLDQQTLRTNRGRANFEAVGCTECHIPDLLIDVDRRVADVETNYDEGNSNLFFDALHAVAAPLLSETDDGSGFPTLKQPNGDSFLVRNIFADFKRHDLGPEFHERNFDGSVTTEFMTEPLWGVGVTGPYGHDGRSLTLRDVIQRHGGEASASRAAYFALSRADQRRVLDFLRSLVIFSPPDTASNLDPADPGHPDYPLGGHGSIKLSVLFNDPGDPE